MKKKDAKEKDNKQKIDYNELINKNLHDFKLTFDYTGYQYTRLDLSVINSSFSPNHSMCCLLFLSSLSTLNTLTSQTIRLLTSHTVTINLIQWHLYQIS